MVEVTLFERIIGHRRVIELLQREADRPANAYLFVGASGLGKATIARRFAALLLCPVRGAHEIECRSCRRIESGNHPDLVEVEPEGRQSLGVDDARATIQMAMLTPVESERKVFLLADAGSMTDQAANALLKTLEEPSRTTVFVLVAESEDDLPPTVASRCRTVHFGRVDEAELVEALIDDGIEPDRAGAIARMAGGRPGLAHSLLSSPEVTEMREAWLAIPNRVTDRTGESFVLADEILSRIEDMVKEIGADLDKEAQKRAQRRAKQDLMVAGLEILASWYTDAAAVQFGGSPRNQDVPLARFAAVGSRRAVGNAELALDAVTDLRANLRPQILLTDLFTKLALES